MNNFIAKNAKWLSSLAFAAILLAAMALNSWIYLLYVQNFGVYAAAEAAGDYEVKSRLMMDAMGEIGPCSPEDAAMLWASGLVERSAARQYAAMNDTLKRTYAKKLDKSCPNWVTGVSSPWVASYRIANEKKQSQDRYVYALLFSTQTSSGPAGEYEVALTIEKDGGYWRVSSISADKRLSPYIGCEP